MNDHRWYVLQVQSGYENHVVKELQRRVNAEDKQNEIEKILVPVEQVVEMARGKKREIDRKFFPGYVLIKMAMNDSLWHLIKKVPRVIGFVGGKSEKPHHISEKEAEDIMQRIQEGISKPKPKVLFEPGEVIRVIDGPFADFNGVVEGVNYDKNKLSVAVLIFGRSTPVELDFSQVEKG